jgi:hypothetical protein
MHPQASVVVLSDMRRIEATAFRDCADGRTGGKALPSTTWRRRGKGESPAVPQNRHASLISPLVCLRANATAPSTS